MKSLIVEKDIAVKLIFADPIENHMDVISVEISFSLSTDAVAGNDESLQHAQIQHNVNFAKINTALEMLNSAVIMDYASVDAHATNFLHRFGNSVVVLPDVSEATLLAALHKKLNTICNDSSMVESLKMKDVEQNIRYEYHNTDLSYEELPKHDEWVSELSYWDTPWWDRYDVSFFDKEAESESELNTWLTLKDEENIAELGSQIFDMIEEEVHNVVDQITGNTASPSGELVEVDFCAPQPKFTPKLV